MRWTWLLVVLLAACTPSGQDRRATSPVPSEGLAVERLAYGEHPDQYLDLHRPATSSASGPTVVLLHGGFWLERYRADLMTPLAEDLAERGYLVANVEYRRVGGAGGWPETFLDVAAALDYLATLDEVPAPVVTVGHSAGGHLAVWAASRHRLPDGATGADPRLRPCGAIAQAGMVDLVASAEAELGRGAVADLVGGTPQQMPDRYAVADPAALLPIGVPVVLVHGEDDRIVPVDISRSYVERAAAVGDPAQLVTLPGGHFEAIDPEHPLWQAVVERLGSICPG